MFDDLWSNATFDHEGVRRSQLLVAARTASLHLWPMLAQAESPADFVNRKALMSERLDKVCSKLTDGDSGGFVALRDDLDASFTHDYRIVFEARQAEQQRENAPRAAMRREASEYKIEPTDGGKFQVRVQQDPGGQTMWFDAGDPCDTRAEAEAKMEGFKKSSAVKTASKIECNSCGHHFERSNLASASKCPKCNSTDLRNAGFGPKSSAASDSTQIEEGTPHAMWRGDGPNSENTYHDSSTPEGGRHNGPKENCPICTTGSKTAAPTDGQQSHCRICGRRLEGQDYIWYALKDSAPKRDAGNHVCLPARNADWPGEFNSSGDLVPGMPGGGGGQYDAPAGCIYDGSATPIKVASKTGDSHYVRRSRGPREDHGETEGREGWVGPIRSPNQADKEKAAWEESGWEAEVHPSSPEVKKRVRDWEKKNKSKSSVLKIGVHRVLATSPSELNDIAEFDHPFEVDESGNVTDGLSGVYAPSVTQEVDADGQAVGEPEIEGGGWEFVDGYSGQYGYSGPIMHASEYLGGGMARDVLADPGIYVVVAVETDDMDDPAGWALLKKTSSRLGMGTQWLQGFNYGRTVASRGHISITTALIEAGMRGDLFEQGFEDGYNAKLRQEAFRKGAPFAGYEDFDACVAANKDKDDPEAYCGSIKHKVEDKKSPKTAASEEDKAKIMRPGAVEVTKEQILQRLHTFPVQAPGGDPRAYALWHGQIVSIKSEYHLDRYADADFFWVNDTGDSIWNTITQASRRRTAWVGDSKWVYVDGSGVEHGWFTDEEKADMDSVRTPEADYTWRELTPDEVTEQSAWVRDRMYEQSSRRAGFEINHEPPDNRGKGSGDWECYGCGARVESLDKGFNTKCPFCGSYELHLSDAAKRKSSLITGSYSPACANGNHDACRKKDCSCPHHKSGDTQNPLAKSSAGRYSPVPGDPFRWIEDPKHGPEHHEYKRVFPNGVPIKDEDLNDEQRDFLKKKKPMASLHIAADDIHDAVREHAEHQHGLLKPGDRVGDHTITEVGTHTVQYQTRDGWHGSVQIPWFEGGDTTRPLPSYERAQAEAVLHTADGKPPWLDKGKDGGGDKKDDAPPADKVNADDADKDGQQDEEAKQGADDPAQMQPGQQVTLHYVLTGSAEGGGDCPATFESFDGTTAIFTYEKGKFGVTNNGSSWIDAAGTEFTFSAGNAVAPQDPNAQKPPEQAPQDAIPPDPNKQLQPQSTRHISRVVVAGTPRDIGSDDEFQVGDRVRVSGGFEDGMEGTITRGGWHHSEAYRPGHPLPGWYIEVPYVGGEGTGFEGREFGPFMSINLDKIGSRRPFVREAADTMADMRRKVRDAGRRVYSPKVQDWFDKVMADTSDVIIDHLLDQYGWHQGEVHPESYQGFDDETYNSVAMHIGETSSIPFPKDPEEDRAQYQRLMERAGRDKVFCADCHIRDDEHIGGPHYNPSNPHPRICSAPYGQLRLESEYDYMSQHPDGWT